MEKKTITKRYTKTKKGSNVRPLNKNGHHSVACVSWNVKANLNIRSMTGEDGNAKNYVTNNNISSSLTLSDCHRSISIDLDAYTKKSARNSLHKIEVLIEELNKLKEVYTKASKLFVKGTKLKKYYNSRDKEEEEKITPETLERFLDDINRGCPRPVSSPTEGPDANAKGN